MSTLTMFPLLIASTLFYTLLIQPSNGQSYNLNPELKVMGPDELTAFLVDRLGGKMDWDLKNWDKRSDSEVKEIFAKHNLNKIDPVPCVDANCKKRYIDEATGSGTIDSTLNDGNQTVKANSQIAGSSLIKLFLERDMKEEAHCLVASVNSSFENQGDGFDYTVNKSVTYGGGVRMKLIMDPEEGENVDTAGLPKLHIIRATSKSELEETTSSENYNDRFVKSTQVTATVVTFDTENCDNSVEKVDCNTLARIYHHIKSSIDRTSTYKGKTKSYKADSYGTIITVVKKA